MRKSVSKQFDVGDGGVVQLPPKVVRCRALKTDRRTLRPWDFPVMTVSFPEVRRDDHHALSSGEA